MRPMQAIRKLLERNPGLLRLDSVNFDKKTRRQRYDRIIVDTFDKLDDIAREYRNWVAKIPPWHLEAGEQVFNFGKQTAEEYDLNLNNVDRLFNEVLPNWTRGALLGFFVSGAYHEVIRENNLLPLDLSNYSGTVSGLGYRHPMGRLVIIGNRTYYLGVRMKDGEIVLKGNAGSHVGKFMLGGQILIEGNVRNWIGQHMRGGAIRIKGNAGHIIGKNMVGGEIVIEGDAGSWVADAMRNGIIRIKGGCGTLDEERSGGEVFQWHEDGWRRIERSASGREI